MGKVVKNRLFGIPLWSRETSETIEERASTPVTSGTLADPSDKLINAINKAFGSSSISGITVNQDTVIGLSAVWRAINVISSTLAGLPLKHYRNTGNGREVIRDSSISRLLKNPNPFMTGFIFRESTTGLAVGHGNGYSVIRRDESTGEPLELIPVHANDVTVMKDNGKLWYIVTLDGKMIVLASENMLHIPGLSFNGLVGFSPVSIARESLEGIIATQRFGNKFFANGANIGGVLESPGTLTDTVYERLRESFAERYQGIDNTGKPAILEGGMKFTKIGIGPEEAQFLQTRQFHVAEIARWFGVPPHMLMDLERSTNNNIEHQGMEFVQYTLLPWANRWEEELNRKLLKKSARDTEYFEHEFNGLMRADAKSRSEYYKGLFAIAAINPSHIAELENLPNPENGEQYYVQGAYVPTNKIDDFYKSKISVKNEKEGD